VGLSIARCRAVLCVLRRRRHGVWGPKYFNLSKFGCCDGTRHHATIPFTKGKTAELFYFSGEEGWLAIWGGILFRGFAGLFAGQFSSESLGAEITLRGRHRASVGLFC
jgi:hypothetical protein